MTRIERDHEPGNGTRYDLALFDDGVDTMTFVWINAPGGGRSMRLYGSTLDGDYLAEKMGLDYDRRKADIKALLLWLDDQGYPVYID